MLYIQFPQHMLLKKTVLLPMYLISVFKKHKNSVGSRCMESFLESLFGSVGLNFCSYGNIMLFEIVYSCRCCDDLKFLFIFKIALAT